jgi:hypothetical protein
MRSQFMLDAETDWLIDRLAAVHAGDRSRVVREPIRLYADLYADMAAMLDEAERSAGLQRTMKRSAADIKAGRVLSTPQLRRRRSRRILQRI